MPALHRSGAPMNDVVQPARGAASGQTRLLQRDDVVLSNGRLALISTHLTPQDAMVEDLHFLRAAFDAAGIAVLLARGDDDRPVIVVDRALRKNVQKVLATACADEPFYARVAGGMRRRAVLVADGKVPSRSTG